MTLDKSRNVSGMMQLEESVILTGYVNAKVGEERIEEVVNA